MQIMTKSSQFSQCDWPGCSAGATEGKTGPEHLVFCERHLDQMYDVPQDQWEEFMESLRE